jgi:hypoxanthine phosphoribosyltransferase
MDQKALTAVYNNARCLHSTNDIARALDDIAGRITSQLADSNPVLLCVMNGGLIFTGQLATRLHFPLQMDYVHATRYREQLSGAELHWRVTPAPVLRGRTVLILDDIFDVGETLSAIKTWCEDQGAASVYTAVLIDKQHNRKTAALKKADFTALYAEDFYLFGYGMDYKGYWRNAPGIYAAEI